MKSKNKSSECKMQRYSKTNRCLSIKKLDFIKFNFELPFQIKYKLHIAITNNDGPARDCVDEFSSSCGICAPKT